jgi:hypothetical protein
LVCTGASHQYITVLAHVSEAMGKIRPEKYPEKVLHKIVFLFHANIAKKKIRKFIYTFSKRINLGLTEALYILYIYIYTHNIYEFFLEIVIVHISIY